MNFDNVALFYDQLASLIFRNNIKKIQTSHLDVVKENMHVLILGGGTGWIITELLQHQPDITITYVEPSSKMIERSKKRLPLKIAHKVNFIKGTHKSIPPTEKYNIIVTNFVLDMLTEIELEEIAVLLYNQLSHKGYWLVCDFQITVGKNELWQKILLKTMILFFRITTGYKFTELPHFQGLFNLPFLHKTKHKTLFSQMIFGSAFQKKEKC